ncbi:MAG: TraB/GumN family protein [DPANN group archaeon]|nr:TraB/GumN family protein [DPANN group archaeon]
MGVKIIGTSHITPISENKRYDIIAIELDRSRFEALMSKAPSKFNFSDALKIGFGGYIFAFIGGILQKYLANKLGAVPGEDMLSAIKLAQKNKSKLVLIDQPIQITLQRFSRNVSLWEKIKFVLFILASPFLMRDKINLRIVPEQKLVDKLTSELRKGFPGIYRVLISDRDKFMANKIVTLRKAFPDSAILVVVGAGHISGLNAALQNI